MRLSRTFVHPAGVGRNPVGPAGGELGTADALAGTSGGPLGISGSNADEGAAMAAKQTEAVRAMIEAMPGVQGSRLPSAPGVTLYKVMGKVFAILNARRDQVSVKCDPHLLEILREQYAGFGHWGHLDRRFWASVDLGPDTDVPPEEAERRIAHSYELVAAKLTRKQKAELAALSA
jgi:predicted DNA-binding protein (MmcQ/YjbR family)